MVSVNVSQKFFYNQSPIPSSADGNFTVYVQNQLKEEREGGKEELLQTPV